MISPAHFAIALVTATLLSGCGQAPPSDEPAAPNAAQSTASSGVKNAPDAQAAPGAAYRIVPPNPNDPKFRPDPKLAGGG